MSTFWRFLIIACVVNTALFTVANLYEIPLIFLLGGELIAFIAFIVAFAYFSKAQRLWREADKAGWSFDSFVYDDRGFRDAIVVRGSKVARISWQHKCVFLDVPFYDRKFTNFDGVERFLKAVEAERKE